MDFDFHFVLPREEVFGPVAPLMRFHSDEEAIKMANDTEFGKYIKEKKGLFLGCARIFKFSLQYVDWMDSRSPDSCSTLGRDVQV